MARNIEDKITTCCSWMEKNPGKIAEVSLSFYQQRWKQSSSWFGRQGEKIYWEQWCANHTCRAPPASLALSVFSFPFVFFAPLSVLYVS